MSSAHILKSLLFSDIYIRFLSSATTNFVTYVWNLSAISKKKRWYHKEFPRLLLLHSESNSIFFFNFWRHLSLQDRKMYQRRGEIKPRTGRIKWLSKWIIIGYNTHIISRKNISHSFSSGEISLVSKILLLFLRNTPQFWYCLNCCCGSKRIVMWVLLIFHANSHFLISCIVD